MIVGIDPGASGALAFLTDAGALISVHDMPTYSVKVGTKKRTRLAVAELADMLRERDITSAYVEKVGAMPGQGTASMFSFGYTAGAIEGVLSALGVPVNFVHTTIVEEVDASPRRQGWVPPAGRTAVPRTRKGLRARQGRWACRGGADRAIRPDAEACSMTDKPPPAGKKPALKRSWLKGQKKRAGPSQQSKARKAAVDAVYERARANKNFVI